MKIHLQGQQLEVAKDETILKSALDAGIYIPHLCAHPHLNSVSETISQKRVYLGGQANEGEEGIPFEGCNLCLVEVEGREGLVHACKTVVEDGMVVHTDSEKVDKARKDNLAKLLEHHPHACLVCAQSEGCDRKICSVHVPEIERCCFKFGMCELQKVSEFIGIEKGLPPYMPLNLPLLEDEPLFERDYNLCISCLRCVKICKEVNGADALGFTVKDGNMVVGTRAETLRESGCVFCGYCIEVCPTGALKDKGLGVGEREQYLIPCKYTCPTEIDIPRYLRFIKDGEPEKALSVIYEKVPFPAVLGRVCFHPCETACRRAKVDQPVAICDLKRVAADLGTERYPQPSFKEKTGKRIAVIGSGPAGLTAAYYLNILGHSVTVFESLPEAGGMLRVGIPAFRLPRHVLDQEINAIKDTGVEIKTHFPVKSAYEILSDGFHAVFVAVGAHQGRKMGIPGEDAEGVIDGITFLREVNLERQVTIGETVAVIGGGNVAIDSARSALRLGAEKVIIFYRRTRHEMPAYDEEIEAALAEGIEIEYQVIPKTIERMREVLKIEFVRMEMQDLDETERRRPVPIEGSEYELHFDTLITAIGQYADVPQGVDVGDDGTAKMEADTEKGIFAGGDLVSGPMTVIEAIASGRKGAASIDKFLSGEGYVDQVYVQRKDVPLRISQASLNADRSKMPILSDEKRTSNFEEVCLGLDMQSAIAEAGRCFGCDLRFQIEAVVWPPEKWLVLSEENIKNLPGTEGVFILYDEQKEIYKICGIENIKESLLEEFESPGDARFFHYEEDPMYTGRERQLTQQYMKKTGRMPPGNDELDDLF